MFIVNLTFSANKANAKQFMQGHNAWIERNFSHGIFLLSGSLQPNLGGGIFAYNCTLEELTARMSDDPFVINDVVKAQITELTPNKTDPKLAFLLANAE